MSDPTNWSWIFNLFLVLMIFQFVPPLAFYARVFSTASSAMTIKFKFLTRKNRTEMTSFILWWWRCFGCEGDIRDNLHRFSFFNKKGAFFTTQQKSEWPLSICIFQRNNLLPGSETSRNICNSIVIAHLWLTRGVKSERKIIKIPRRSHEVD